MAPKMVPSQTLKLRNIDKIGIYKEMVVRGRIELPTRRFSVCCSTD